MASEQTSDRRAALVCSLTRMRQELQQMITDKARPLRGAGILLRNRQAGAPRNVV
jgi:hypothetical protein